MTERKLAKNTTYFTAALSLQKVLSFIYFWFISNNLFPDQLGKYVFALSFTTLFSIFIDLGLSPILTREASKDDKKANKYFQNILALKIPLAIITVAAAWLVINITNKPADVRQLVYLASCIMVIDSFTLSAWVIFRAKHKLLYESIATILVQIIIFIAGLTALFNTDNIAYLIGALLLASIFNFLFSLLLLKKKLHFSLKPEYNKEITKYFLKILPAFAIAGVFVKIYNTSDSVLLSYLDGDEAVGFFSVSAKIIYAFQQVIPAAFAAVIFPAFSYYYKHAQEHLVTTFKSAIRYLLIISLPLCTGLALLASQLINLLWPQYNEVIPTFVVMSLAIPFIFLAFPTGYLLNACDKQKQNTINRGIITVLAIILNILLIPKLSYYGAGLTFLITNITLLCIDYVLIKKIIAVKISDFLPMLLKTGTATAIMTILLYFLQNMLHPVILILIAIPVYFISLMAIKGLSIQELRLSK